ncbi:hypothetical protein DE146DRAFT_318321 [Phaeosphaeria sp. MPI-PUGE-AT-0046c]|nr:hypothetical protein DE146DRAFT_318321 [Phaeosphaeria sp. MPI-PUGE-AT-0046c]
MVAMGSIAIWSMVPLVIRLLTTMKRRSGLYFYAILITSCGISTRQFGILTLWLIPGCPWVLRRLLVEVGTIAMVSGFSVVLYSRLGLICTNLRVRRAILIMIICNGFIWHTVSIVSNGGIRYLKNRRMKSQLAHWERVHAPLDKTQFVMFSAQEIIISSLYVRAAYHYLQSKFNAQKSKTRSTMCLLLLAQIVIISLDITIIALNLAGFAKLKVIIHSFIYSIKLELEFVVLNQLIDLSKMGISGIPSISHAAPEVRGTPRQNAVASPDAGTGRKNVPAWEISIDSTVDVESCVSGSTAQTLTFITTPQNMSGK